VSSRFTRESDDLFVIHVSGVFTFDDLKEVENSSSGIKATDNKVKVLITTEDLAGWGKEGDWGDLTFMYEIDPHIDKIAVVAEDKWKDQRLMFLGAGRRQAEVRFFFEDEEEYAREWLQE
jgi:hypothetical protein